MKISLNSQFLNTPYGGGMQFANYLRDFLLSKNISVINHLEDPDIDLILNISPFPFLTPGASAYSFLSAYAYKLKHPETIIVERVNECDERKGTHHINRLLTEAGRHSDFVIFIAHWLKPLLEAQGFPKNKPSKIILNGADKQIFNTIGKKFWSGKGKLKIVTHHWSNNIKKGHKIYRKLDQLLNDSELAKQFEFTYIGSVPKTENYMNTKIVAPLTGKELGDELKKHDLYITASENEPAGMHHIEGALCGLPILYINSGALPEYCRDFGIEFNDSNLEQKILEARSMYGELSLKMQKYNNTAERMAEEYLSVFQELYKNRRNSVSKDLRPILLIHLFNVYYIIKFKLLKKLKFI